MSDKWLRRIAWAMATVAIAILIVSIVLLLLAPYIPNDSFGYGNAFASLVALGGPILGLLIVRSQPRNRIGWLFLAFGFSIGLRSLGHGIYYFHNAQPTGYSSLELFLLWVTEPTNLTTIVGFILLLLWFPDGQLPSKRWRLLYLWMFLAYAVLFLSNFTPGSGWNGGAEAGGIVITNPYGWLILDPASPINDIGFPSFLSLLMITLLSAISLVFRYRAASQLVRRQIGWFVLGGFFSLVLFLLPVFPYTPGNQNNRGFTLLLDFLGQAYIIPLYLAVGAAILRYRLYDIDVIIRKTLQYGVLTALLALVYFASIVLLQSMVDRSVGEQSPVVIVLSTLLIAALFNPLRRRVQAFIDRRFFRKKVDAQQVLAQFAQTARDETDMDALQAELLCVVQETMQPEQANIWLKPTPAAVRTSFRSGHE